MHPRVLVACAALSGCGTAGYAGARGLGGSLPEDTCDQPAALERPALTGADGHASFRGLGRTSGLLASAAIDTSADGEVVAGFARERGVARDRGALWREGTTRRLPYPDLEGEDSQWVYAISGDGEVAVGEVTATGTSSLAAMWRSCELRVLGLFPGASSAAARGVSQDGKTIVGFGLVAAGECSRPSCYGSFVFEEGEMTRLRDDRGAPLVGQAKDVSADGRVIVGWGTARNEAFRIDGGQLRWLGFAAGATDSRAEAVSADGAVVVGASGEVAFRASGGRLEPLETLPGFPRSYAYGVSRHGCRIVGNTLTPAPPRDERPRECHDPDRWLADPTRMRALCKRTATPPQGPAEAHAFLWEQGRGTRLLRDVLQQEHGIDVGAWVLDEAFGISTDGTTIVGDGKNPEGTQEAWVVRLPPAEGCEPR